VFLCALQTCWLMRKTFRTEAVQKVATHVLWSRHYFHVFSRINLQLPWKYVRRASRDCCVMPTFDNMLILVTYLKVLLQHKGEGEQTDIEIRRCVCVRQQRSKCRKQQGRIAVIQYQYGKQSSTDGWIITNSCCPLCDITSVIQLPLMSSIGQMMGKAKERSLR